ncbi:MAG: hypothetical protein O2960_25625 [Verrucomicrobia bacterium]|jgi:predicted DNA-binding protein|nr:hypothetical protein [Verrucomicrobiota bacterium]
MSRKTETIKVRITPKMKSALSKAAKKMGKLCGLTGCESRIVREGIEDRINQINAAL